MQVATAKAAAGQPVSAIANATMPLQIIHGDRDDTIPPALGREVFAASPPRRLAALPPCTPGTPGDRVVARGDDLGGIERGFEEE